jgi:thiol-disulfide isomerase/thioredoxin
MKKIGIEWKMLSVYLFILFLLAVTSPAFSQVKAVHFNAGFNAANDVEWFSKLKECDRQTLLIDGNDNQARFKIAVVPTIIIFDDGEEVKRFQADLSFKLVATKQEVQDYIDELIMSKF